MSAFIVSERIWVINKGRVKYPIQFLKNNVMNQSVFDFSFMDYSVLGIVNMEFNIRIVLVG